MENTELTFNEQMVYNGTDTNAIGTYEYRNEHYTLTWLDDSIDPELESKIRDFIDELNEENIIVSLDRMTIYFSDYENREDFIRQMSSWYSDTHNWELPPDEDFGEYWDYITEGVEKIIMSIKYLSLNFYDYENREDFISQMEIFYNENNWELPEGEDVGEYWDYNTATTEEN